MAEDFVTKVDLEDRAFNEALRASQKDRDESERYQKFYTGYNKGQWSVDAKNRLESRGSIVPQINLAKGKLKRLAGSVVKNHFDVQFIPVSTAETPATRKLNGIFASDSNTFDYDMSYLGCVLNGLIHVGVEQMKLSTRYSPIGNITFENILPGNVIIDPFWKSNDTWDINHVWKVAYLTPQEIVDKYGRKNDKIRSIINHIKTNGIDYGNADSDSDAGPYWNLNTSYGHKYRVIEHHYLEKKVQVVKLARIKTTKETIELPEGDTPNLMNELDSVGVQFDELDDVITRRVTKKIYKVRTSCIELDQFNLLEDAQSDIQIGRLPFFPLSADRHGGKNCGIAMLLEDTQKLLNGRESQSDEQINANLRGALAIDPLLFGGNDAMTERAMRELDRPDAKIKTATGMLANNKDLIRPIQKAPYNGEIQNEIMRLSNYFDSLSGQTATLDGGKESAHDTGRLFAQRAVMSEIALTVLTKNLENHQRDKFEAWMLYAPKVYGGMYREFTVRDKNGNEETISVNKRVYHDDVVEVEDDLAALRRHKVIITPSKDGLTVRETDRARNVELLNVVTNPISRVILERNAMETVDNSIREKREMDRIYDITLEAVIKEEQLRLATAEAQLMQLNVQTAQMMQQMGMDGQQQGGQQAPAAPAQQQGQSTEQGQPLPQGMNNNLR